MSDSHDRFVLAQSELLYSIDELEKENVLSFLKLIRTKKASGWTVGMIETHLVANISNRIKTNYAKLTRIQREKIAKAMIQTMLERIINEQLNEDESLQSQQ